ncbi:MAG: hypothetical protein M1834_001025 [Cirrosporium novae-zelandiae]|nr:MAG: hypothetical protein M1834_001025 [Cirrosporium novae-zelandiae]
MQSRGGSPSEGYVGRGSARAGTKRKLVQPSESIEHQPLQKDIPELFLTSKPSPALSEPVSSSSKKPKRESAPRLKRSRSDMYTFESRSPKGTQTIDLTKPPMKNTSDFAKAFTPHAGAKKIVVKNLRQITKVDPTQYLNRIWVKLEAALEAIFNEQRIPHPLEELYRGVESLCRQGQAAEVARRLRLKCLCHTSMLRNTLQGMSKANSHDHEVLKDVITAWEKWSAQLVTIRTIFFYLDRSYLLNSAEYPQINEMGLSQFGQSIYSDKSLKPKIIHGVCELISEARNERTLSKPNEETLRQAIKLFHELLVFSKEVEPAILGEGQKYFVAVAKDRSQSSLSEYVQFVLALIDDEIRGCNVYGLDDSTKREFLRLIDEHLIEEKQSILVDVSNISALLERNDKVSLERLYRVLQRRGLCLGLKPAFEEFIYNKGCEIAFDEEHENEMVVKLLLLKANLDDIWKTAFQKDAELGITLRKSFEKFINETRKTQSAWGTDNHKPGEMIAKYIDNLLRGGVKAIPASLRFGASSAADKTKDAAAEEEDQDEDEIDDEAEIEKQLEQVLDLFRFIHGKAVFEAFYKKDLARRLLMNRSASADAEKNMLEKLKDECGSNFTQNLESMFQDITLSKEEGSAYKALLSERGDIPEIDLSVSVLGSAAWPTYPEVPVTIPADVKQAIDGYEEFYSSKHTGRQLTWKHNLEHCQLRARFPKGNKELVVSAFQAIVLLLFNDIGGGESIGYQDLKAVTGLADPELQRTLQSLACGNYRVLLKSTKGPTVSPTDTFKYNTHFTSPKYRIKINTIQLKETKQENKETHERIAMDRHLETQAAIVRIMKGKKECGYQELVVEVINETTKRGQLAVAEIKKEVDRLIEKEYVERSEEKPGWIRYVA